MALPQIDTHAKVAFDNHIKLQAQQVMSKLRRTVVNETLEGEKKYFDDYGEASMVERLTRGQENTPQEIDRGRRAISPRDFEYTEEFDLQKDEVRLRRAMKTDSAFAKAIAASVARQIDELIVEAYDSTAYSGKDGTTAVTFDTDQDVALATGAGEYMNTTKARAARKLHSTNNVFDLGEPVFMVLTPAALDQMLGSTIATSSDYNTVQALVDGKMTRWLGMEWIESTRPGFENSSPDYYAFSYARSAMIFGIDPGSIITEWEKLPGRGLTWQYAVYGTFAATRRFENQIVRIDNDDSLVVSDSDGTS